MTSLIALIAAASAAVCVEPSGPKITAADLAAAVPALASVPPDRVVGYAPQPGVTRRITAAELARLGSFRQSDMPDSVCVAWRLARPDADSFRTAMESELPEGAQLAILETSQFPVPPGPLHFPIAMLHGALWRGYVEYSPGLRFDIWARVEVRVPCLRLVAAQDIAAGTALTESALQSETTACAPGTNGFVSSLAAAVGRTSRRSIRQGTPVPLSALGPLIDVRKGDTLRVRVRAGSASIAVQAVALAPAAAGETIPVRVNDTGRTVRVRVGGPGEASLQLAGGN